MVIEPLGDQEGIPDNVKAAIILFTALLDEQQLRLFAGVEALQFGRGAESWIADLLGIHRQTVAKGRQQLHEGNVLSDGVRRKGAGRPRMEKKTQKSSKKSKT
jgi:predicted ArsR family transcriptional regulator